MKVYSEVDFDDFEEVGVEDFIIRTSRPMPSHVGILLSGEKVDIRNFIKQKHKLIEATAISILNACYKRRFEAVRTGHRYCADGDILLPGALQTTDAISKELVEVAAKENLTDYEKLGLYSFFCEYYQGAVLEWVGRIIKKHPNKRIKTDSKLIRSELVNSFWHILTVTQLFFELGVHQVLMPLERSKVKI